MKTIMNGESAQAELRKFRFFSEKANDAHFLIDAEARFLYVNPLACESLGYSEKELLRMSVPDIDPLFNKERIRALFDLLKKGRLQAFESVHRRKDGSIFPVEISCAVLQTNGSWSLFATVRDITARKQAEETLRESEKRLRTLVDATFEGIAISEEGRLVDLNEQLTRILGYSRDDLIGSLALDYVAPEDRVRVSENIRLGRESLLEHGTIRKDGQRIIVEAHGKTIDLGGRQVRFTAIRDVTENRRAQQALRESEERFRLMAETVPEILFTSLPDGGLDYSSARFYEFTGMKPGSANGPGWIQALHPDDRERVRTHWSRCLAAHTPYEGRQRLRAADGSYRWFMARARPVHDAEGKVVKWFGTCADINQLVRTQTALIQAEKKLARVNRDLERTVQERTARLQEAMAELEHFSYTITHDMRAPLRAMHGFGQILLEEAAGSLSKEHQDFLRRIVKASERMDNLIRDALSYSRIVRQDFELQSVDSEALLQELLESYPEFQPPQASIRLEHPLPHVEGNRAGLTQCFANLLNNAVKFVKPGERPQIRIWAEDMGGTARIWFEDQGIGIPAGQEELIFGMFQKLHPHYEGTGIGLALVRKAAERMGGEVGVESEAGHGSRFWLEFKKAEPSRAPEKEKGELAEAR